MCRPLNAFVAMFLLSLIPATALHAQDGNNVTPTAITATSTTAVVTKTALTPTPAHPVYVIAYFSSKADTGKLATPQSRQRLKYALDGVSTAKKPVSKGGAGFKGGHRDVEKYWNDFVKRLPEKESEAEAYRPLLHRGGVIIIITDEQSWTYGPLLISEAADPCAQILLLYSKHEELYPTVDVSINDKLPGFEACQLYHASPARCCYRANINATGGSLQCHYPRLSSSNQ